MLSWLIFPYHCKKQRNLTDVIDISTGNDELTLKSIIKIIYTW